ncbi:ATPase [Sporanaerobium hydrogeniformans]|uniref:ATPase n=1 Tax=Sporanaerobium hydrogeniformans TaxID=3072179 RepID=A0AC61DGG0_9FIRM|nr:ATPase [Sporanaerobium hydrogeniformans]PHV71816.1 ATPase [Sporanaerobium hydrogeniformans]
MDENARCGELAILLDQLEDLIEEGKTSFLSNRISVDREEMIEIIREIRLKLPTEVQQSIWIVEERNKILTEAQKEAHLVMEEAHEKLQNMIEQHEITKYAKGRAEEIIEAARQDAREIHHGSVAYADETVRKVELKLKNCLETVHKEMQDFEAYVTDVLRELYDNRQELKVMNTQMNEREE